MSVGRVPTSPRSAAGITSVGAGLTVTAGVLSDDLATGKAGGQTITGGTAASENLDLRSTSNAVKGLTRIGGTAAFIVDEANVRLGFGITPAVAFHVDVKGSTARFESTTGACRIDLQAPGGNIGAIRTAGGSQLIIDNPTNVQLILMVGGMNQLVLDATAGLQVSAKRFAQSKGADVASAATLTLGTDGSIFGITGVAAINFITTTNWQAGSVIYLRFAAAATVNHNAAAPPGGTASVLLSGAANITFAANTVLGLLFDGTNWIDLRKIG